MHFTKIITDYIRDCRKSPILAFLRISHVVKSDSYKPKNYALRVFRQPLRQSSKYQRQEYCKVMCRLNL
jgi:hypothetical protein